MKILATVFVIGIVNLLCSSNVQAAIVTRTFSNLVLEASLLGEFALDVDLDGNNDFTIQNFYSNDPTFILGFAQTTVPFASRNGVVIDSQTGDGFPTASLLSIGTTVGPSSLFSFGSNDFGNLFSTDPFNGTTGNFGGRRGFLGLQFDSGGQLHYGFADIEVNGLNSSTPFDLRLYSVSYETIAGQSAVVAVPEPSSGVALGLVVVGAILFSRVKKSHS